MALPAKLRINLVLLTLQTNTTKKAFDIKIMEMGVGIIFTFLNFCISVNFKKYVMVNTLFSSI